MADIPEAAYQAAARAGILADGPHSPPWTEDDLAQVASGQAGEPALRAAVDAVWALAHARGRADAKAELDRETT